MLLKTGAKNSGFFIFEDIYLKIMRSSELTGKLDEQANYESYDKYVKKLSENYGEHSEESIGVFGRPAE